MTNRPWWQRPGGLPPSMERRRRRPLSPRMVVASRASLLLGLVLAIGLAMVGQVETVGGLVVAVVLSWWTMPDHQRRLGRA